MVHDDALRQLRKAERGRSLAGACAPALHIAYRPLGDAGATSLLRMRPRDFQRHILAGRAQPVMAFYNAQFATVASMVQADLTLAIMTFSGAVGSGAWSGGKRRGRCA